MQVDPRGAEERALEWVDLQQLALRIAPLASGAQMAFPVDQAARIEDLTERERGCCAFLAIVTWIEGDECMVEITSENPDGLGIIAALSGVTLP